MNTTNPLGISEEVRCDWFGEVVHHPSLWKAEKQQRLHLKGSKMTNEFAQLSGRQRRPLPWQPHKVTCSEGQRGCLSHAKLPVTNETRLSPLTSTEKRSEMEWKIPCVQIDEIVLCALPTRPSFPGKPRHIWNWERQRLAVQSAGEPFRKALKFSRGLGAALQKPLCVSPLRKTCIEFPEIFISIYISKALEILF